MPDLFANSKLRDELSAWQDFIAALSPDDRETFGRVIGSATTRYGDFVETAPRGREIEALLLSILLSQQKKIEELKQALGSSRRRRIGETQS